MYFLWKKLGVKNKGTIRFTNHFDLGWKENSLIKTKKQTKTKQQILLKIGK